MKRENDATVDILRHARHFLKGGKYANSIPERRTPYICRAIEQVKKYMGLDYLPGDYYTAQKLILDRVRPGVTLVTLLRAKVRDAGGSFVDSFPEGVDSPNYPAARDEWLDTLIRELEEEE